LSRERSHAFVRGDPLAKTVELTIPAGFLAAADEVIE
jgi:hypothetical protein